MWSDLTEVAAFCQRLLHHSVLLVVEAQHGLLQVAYATVDQLGASAARARREVKLLDKCHLQTYSRPTHFQRVATSHAKHILRLFQPKFLGASSPRNAQTWMQSIDQLINQ